MHSKNVKIHLCCIPLILSSAIVIIHNFNYHLDLSLAIVYSAYYLLLDTSAGLLATLYLVIVELTTNLLYSYTSDHSTVFKAAILVHIISWLLQFYGHFHYEKRSPAVLDNLIQPLVLAPYFVLFELLFIYGYKKDLEGEMMSRARSMRALFDANK